MRERLRFLYGDQIGDAAFAELERLLDRVRPRLRSRLSDRSGPSVSAGQAPAERTDDGPTKGLFDQGDAVLIAYGDSILAPERSPLQALNDFATRQLGDLVSTIHVLPFFPYSSDYGFSVIDYEQVDPALGTWDDIAALRSRFKLMFDFVLNHVSAESRWFQAFLRAEPPFDRYFITQDPAADLSGVTRPRTSPLLTRFDTAAGERFVWTTFSADQVDLNYANPELLLRMIELMLSYVEHGADLLRMDAVGYLWKEVGTSCIHLERTHQVVKLMRDVLNATAPSVAIVTETNVPHADNVSYFGDGGDEAHMVYQFPLAPLVLDALARGDGTILSRWAADLRTPSDQTTFFNFLASHDGIGVVPARGLLSDAQVVSLVRRTLAHGGEVSHKTNPDGSESPYELNVTFFDALSDPNDRSEPFATKLDRFICSQAIMLAVAGVPGIYIHSLFGSHNDRAGYERSGWKRDLNHERLQLGTIERRLDDPASEPARVFGRYAQLLRIRRAQPAFHPQARQRVLALDERILALLRGPRDGQTVLALHNLADEPRTVDLAAVPTTVSSCRSLLNGRASVTERTLTLAPYEVAWFALS